MKTFFGQPKQPVASISLIGKGCNFTGKMKTNNIVDIAGNFEGEIEAAEVNIRSEAVFSGIVAAKIIRINGTLEGSVNTEELVVGKGGVVRGKMTYKTIIIEAGGLISGELEGNSKK